MSFRNNITFSPAQYSPPGGGYGGGYTKPGPGSSPGPITSRPITSRPITSRPTGTGNDQVRTGNDHQVRVSPTVYKDERGRPYQETMEHAHVIGKNNAQIRIDVDRDGGIFLDHGELAQLLDSGDIQNVITNVKSQILSAKARYKHAGDHRVS
jgi:hypothetical protein